MATNWLNSDGLYIEFDRNAATASVAGEYDWDGSYHRVELTIDDLSLLTSSAVIQDNTTTIPKNARIDRVEVVTDTVATSGGSATLNIGLIRTDRSTNLSDTALVSALALTSIDAAGETTAMTSGSTSVGSSVGTTTANPYLITAKYGTAAFTAGKVIITIFYRMSAV